MTGWKRNVIMIALSQFFSMMGFSFAMPFAPYYIQQLGVTDPHSLKLWISLFTAATPLTLAIFSPIWGAVGDRYGRRLMLMRANFGAMLVLFLMGMVPNVQCLVILRLVQGVLTGTVNAAQTMVSVHSPTKHSGLVLGTLSAAIYSGVMCGTFVGGLLAEWLGYRVAFLCSSVLLLTSGLLVLFGTREQFVPPITEESVPFEKLFQTTRTKIGSAMPILLLMSLMGLVIQFDGAWLPLLVQEINGGLRGASFWTGSLAAICGIAGFLAGPIIGRVADLIAPPRIGKFSAGMAGLMSIIVGLSYGFIQLFAGRFWVSFFAGGLDPVFMIWLAKTTPPERRGFIFGWAVTAKAMGWMSAALISGLVAWLGGLRAVFFVAAGLFFLLIPAISLIVNYRKPAPRPTS